MTRRPVGLLRGRWELFSDLLPPQHSTMTYGESPRSPSRVSRRRSLSEGCNLHLLTAITEGEPLKTQPESDHNPHADKLRVPVILAQRSKSESVICTAQGVKFQDACHKYQTRLDNLRALAFSPSSSQSNALLAQKALRYRNKAMERRRAVQLS